MTSDSNHDFQHVLAESFPGTIPLNDFFNRTSQVLAGYGFNDNNTLGVVATCRDEVASPLEHEVIKHWGRTFSCRSLAGFLLLGRSGIKTGIHHAPLLNGRRRFVFFAMPHIAISANGKVGVIYREGIHEESHACGSIASVISQLESGRIDMHMDFEDLEQSIVRQKIISVLRYGEAVDLIEGTKIAHRIIRKDTERLLAMIAKPSEFDYAYFTGILIHGPDDQDWIYPGDAAVIQHELPTGREPIDHLITK